jgi:hypothetical protein
MTTLQFTALIEKNGAKACISLPFNPNEVWGTKQRHYVRGTINGCMIRSRLDPDAFGIRFSLPLGPAWRRDNQLDAGDEVEVILFPEGPQSEQLAEDISAALAAEPQARMFFDGLATFYRKNYIRWIESAKHPETRAARIEEMILLLKAGKKQK